MTLPVFFLFPNPERTLDNNPWDCFNCVGWMTALNTNNVRTAYLNDKDIYTAYCANVASYDEISTVPSICWTTTTTTNTTTTTTTTTVTTTTTTTTTTTITTTTTTITTTTASTTTTTTTTTITTSTISTYTSNTTTTTTTTTTTLIFTGGSTSNRDNPILIILIIIGIVLFFVGLAFYRYRQNKTHRPLPQSPPVLFQNILYEASVGPRSVNTTSMYSVLNMNRKEVLLQGETEYSVLNVEDFDCEYKEMIYRSVPVVVNDDYENNEIRPYSAYVNGNLLATNENTTI